MIGRQGYKRVVEERNKALEANTILQKALGFWRVADREKAAPTLRLDRSKPRRDKPIMVLRVIAGTS